MSSIPHPTCPMGAPEPRPVSRDRGEIIGDPRLYAVIDPRSPRYARWCLDLGGDCVPVLSAEPELTRFEGSDEVVSVYLVDLDALSAGQLAAILARTALDHGVGTAAVLAEYRELGLPISCEEIIVCEDPGVGRLGFPFWAGESLG